MASLGYFPYHEPNLVQILILTSFFVFLQLARAICDSIANVGILGELFVGLVYGAPLANILLEDWAASFTAVGYLGLIILVLEGGMSTNLSLAKRNLPLSSLVALMGLLAPILLSHPPRPGFHARAGLHSRCRNVDDVAWNDLQRHLTSRIRDNPSWSGSHQRGSSR